MPIMAAVRPDRQRIKRPSGSGAGIRKRRAVVEIIAVMRRERSIAVEVLLQRKRGLVFGGQRPRCIKHCSVARSLISRCRGRGRVKLRQRSVSIRRRPQSRSGGRMRIGS